jgi:acryloyl-coenzyme A reductase
MTAVRSARLAAAGWERALELEAAPLRAPGPGEVTLEIEACGVCFRDCIDRDGRFPFLRLPVTPGHEVVGRVLEVGDEMAGFRAGDRVATMHRDACGDCPACAAEDTGLCERAAGVLGLLIDGGYATHAVVPETCLYPVPHDLERGLAAILHCTFGTAYRALTRHGRPVAGERVVVTGANGGVGSATVQVARRLGLEVIAVVRDADAAAFVAGLGAAAVVVDDGAGFHKRLGASVSVAVDCVGEPTFNASVRSVRVGGRVVAVGNVRERRAELNLGYVITRGITVVGSSGASRREMTEVLALHAAEPLAASVETWSLDRADEAQRRVRAGGLCGRLTLVP